MIKVKNEKELSDFCHHRQKMFFYRSCDFCPYRDRSKEKTLWEDCMFDRAPWREKFSEGKTMACQIFML